jgi:5-methylthioribose kinase
LRDHCKKKKLSWKVPEVFEIGKYNQLQYYIGEYIPEKQLGLPKPDGCKNLNRHLNALTDISLLLLKIKSFKLPFDRNWDTLKSQEQFYKRIIKKWYLLSSQQKIMNIDALYEKVLLLKENYKGALNHGDFAPWHIIHNRGTFTLIDSELSSNYNPIFFDVAHFYHRVYINANNSRVAKEYAQLFRKKLSNMQKQLFDKTFGSIVALRTIGCFSEIFLSKRNAEIVKLYCELEREIREDSLLEVKGKKRVSKA